MVKRDLAAEQRAVGTFQGNNKRLPDLNNPKERADVYRLAYPPSAGGLPPELTSTVDRSLYEATGTSTYSPLSQTVEGSNLEQLGTNVQSAQAEVQKTSQPNTALRVLQEAIRAKSGMGTQGIGESSLFKEAGVTGIGALSQSIAAQGAKLDNDFANFSNIVGQMSGTYKDMATSALNNYQMAYQAYKDESDRLQKITDNAQQHAEALDLMNQQYQNSLKLEQYKRQNPDLADVISARDAGLVQDSSGKWVEEPDGFVPSPSGHSYDLSAWSTDPNQPAGVRNKLAEMGKLETPEDITSYLNEYMPSSGITANDVMSAAEAYDVGWEELLAITALESTNGTSNVFQKNNNPSGITWNANFPESMKGTPRPANEGGNYVKFPTIADGLAFTAKTLNKPIYKKDQVSVGGSVGTNITPEGWDVSKFTPEFYSTKSGEKVLNNEQQYRNNFISQPAYREFLTVQNKARTLEKVVSNGFGGANDIAAVFEFMKSLDPGSVVREKEFETAATKGGNLFAGAFAKFNGYFQKPGGFLPEDVKKEFLKLANQKLEVSQQYYNEARDDARRTAFEQGLNPDHVATNLKLFGSLDESELDAIAQQLDTEGMTLDEIMQEVYQ